LDPAKPKIVDSIYDTGRLGIDSRPRLHDGGFDSINGAGNKMNQMVLLVIIVLTDKIVTQMKERVYHKYNSMAKKVIEIKDLAKTEQIQLKHYQPFLKASLERY
jgi:hypothetical protein